MEEKELKAKAHDLIVAQEQIDKNIASQAAITKRWTDMKALLA